MLRLIFLEKICNKFNIKYTISSSLADISLGSLLIRFSAYKKIKVIFLSGQMIRDFKNYKNCFVSASRLSKSEIKNLDRQHNTLVIKNYIKNKFYNLKVNLNNQGYYVRPETFIKAYKSKKKMKLKKINIIKKKKIFLLALNCFSDTPHYQGKIIFRDFYDHFVKTINFLKKENSDDFVWLVKPHPAVKFYNESGVVEEHLKKLNAKNINICPNNLGNIEIFKHVDCLTSAVSTIALEYACFGKRPIICSKTAYSGYGFTKEPKTQEEYFQIISSSKYNNKLSEIDKLKAQRIYYYLDNFSHQNIKSSKLLPVRKKISDNKYFELLLKKSKKFNIKRFHQDPFYKDLIFRGKNFI